MPNVRSPTTTVVDHCYTLLYKTIDPLPYCQQSLALTFLFLKKENERFKNQKQAASLNADVP